MRVLVVAEYYPRAADPVRGIWAHRQTLAARDAGTEVSVLVLHRPVPPLATVRRGDFGALRDAIAQPRRAQLDGLDIGYVRYISPPRPLSYGSWGAWAAPFLKRALSQSAGRFDLIHAHYAVPAGDAVRRAAPDVPLVVSVHGHDVYGAGTRMPAVRQALGHAALVLANSAGTARRSAEHGARATRVIHLGTDLPPTQPSEPRAPTLVTVGHLVRRKRHEDVIHALALLTDRHPQLHYEIVGDGPEREPLRVLAASLGVGERVALRGQLPPDQAVRAAQQATVFVLPSVDEAFGVAYVEAMAGGVPAIGSEGEDGPAEIVAAGGGMTLVPPGNPPALASAIDELLSDPERQRSEGEAARATVEREFTWARCGAATVAAYESVLHPQ